MSGRVKGEIAAAFEEGTRPRAIKQNRQREEERKLHDEHISQALAAVTKLADVVSRNC